MPKRGVIAFTRGVELYHVECIATDPPGGTTGHQGLVTSANETLQGCNRPYFPIGGPCPEPSPSGVRSDSWGGMDIGDSSLYAPQCVDGVVGREGGRRLREACARHVETRGLVPVGGAASTVSTGRLAKRYGAVVHAVAPFWSDENWENLLLDAYESSFQCARDLNLSFLALPLLGAGAKGAPISDAARVAAAAVERRSISINRDHPPHLRFAVTSVAAFEAVEAAMESVMDRIE